MAQERRWERVPTVETCCFALAADAARAAAASSTLQLAVAGPDADVVLRGLAAVPTTHIVLLHRPRDVSPARELRDVLCRGGIVARVEPFDDEPFFGLIRRVGEVLDEARLTSRDIHLNVSSGTPDDGCALTTCAFLHGVHGFHIESGTPMPLPLLAHAHRDTVGPTKGRILGALSRRGGAARPRRLALDVGLPVGELHDHVDGRLPGSAGLLRLGLVERRRGLLGPTLALTPSGVSLLASHILVGTTV